MAGKEAPRDALETGNGEGAIEQVHSRESQQPLHSPASPIDMAVIWVNKAAKGSVQWTDEVSQKQIAHYQFRKKLKPLTVLVKYMYLGIAFFEVPSWCLVKDYCIEHEGVYSWRIPQLPFQISNALDIFCLLYLAQTFWHRHRSLGSAKANSWWHVARILLTLLALVDCCVAIFNRLGIVPGSFRVCRVCRPLIVMCTTKFLRKTLKRLCMAFLDFWTVLASLALCVIFFVWLGIVIFARTKEGEHHFDEWSQSAASLWILFTTANFPDVMVDSYSSSRMSFLFFFCYLVISLYLLNNILLASVYDAYKAQLRSQLQTFYRKKAHSIDRAFQLLCDQSSGESTASSERVIEAQSIGLRKWVDFFTAYCVTAAGIGSRRDHDFIEQQAMQTFRVLDTDSSGYISKEEFKVVVQVLSDPQVYIPLRPIPEVGSTTWGTRLRILFQQGIPLPRSHRLPWWVVIDSVVLSEICMAFVQTVIFVSPQGGKFSDAPLMPDTIWSRLLSFTTVVVLADMLLQMLTFGLERFWNKRRLRNRFDVFSISALCGVELASWCIKPDDTLLRTILALHILRGICLIQHVPPLRYLAAMVAHLVPVYHQLGFLLFLVYYIFATMGVQIFGGQIYEGNPKLDNTGFAEAGYWPLNFNDFPSSLVTLFCLMVVNNWYVVADGFMAVTSNYAAIFFVLFFVTCNLVVLNILMTLILESSATVQKELQAQLREGGDSPQRSWSRGQREFFLQRMLLNEDERLDSVVSGHIRFSEG